MTQEILQFGALGLLGGLLYGLGHGAVIAGRYMAAWLDEYKRDNRETLTELRATQARIADTQDRLADLVERSSGSLTQHAAACHEHGSILGRIDQRVDEVHAVVVRGLPVEHVRALQRVAVEPKDK